METAPQGEGQGKKELPPHFQSGVGKQPLCGWAHPLFFLARCSPWQPSFQIRGTAHQHLVLGSQGSPRGMGMRDQPHLLDRKRSRPGFESGLQSFSTFPQFPPASCLSGHEGEGKESAHAESGLSAAQRARTHWSQGERVLVLCHVLATPRPALSGVTTRLLKNRNGD